MAAVRKVGFRGGKPFAGGKGGWLGCQRSGKRGTALLAHGAVYPGLRLRRFIAAVPVGRLPQCEGGRSGD